MIGAELVKVELAPRELVMFNTLYEAGVFSIKNGSVLLNFDSEGTLTQIETKVISFKRGYPQGKSKKESLVV